MEYLEKLATRIGEPHFRVVVYNEYQDGTLSKTEMYTYDTSGRLVQVNESDGTILDYIYDSLGNLTGFNFVIDAKESETGYNYDYYQGNYDFTSRDGTFGNGIDLFYYYQTDALKRLDHLDL
jgi:YD repeat-containing protein